MIEYDQFTNKQKILYDHIMSTLPITPTHGKERPLMQTFEELISGVAGAGKTTLVALLVRDLTVRGYKVFMTAPTHQAAQELQKAFAGSSVEPVVEHQVSDETGTATSFRFTMSQQTNISIPPPPPSNSPKFVGTIHSALGLKMAYNEDQKELKAGGNPKTSIRNQFSSNVTYECDVLFCDEGSMNSPKMHELMRESQRADRFHIIHIGDRYQLEPPDGNGEQSTVFDVPTPTVLDEVTRQAAESKIIQFSAQCRAKIDYFEGRSTDNPQFKFMDYLDGDSMIKLPMSQVVGKYIEMVGGDCKNSTDYRIHTYTNARVDQFNAAIRSRLLGADAPEIVVGENVILQASSPELTFSNNQEVNIISCEPTEVVVSLPKDISAKGKVERELDRSFDGFKITAESTSDKARETFEILSEKGRGEYLQWMANFRKHYFRMKEDVSKRASSVGWREYWAVDAKYPEIKYPYCTTVHKAQGSTFNEVIFDLETIQPLFRSRPTTAWRLIYVASTRPRYKVYFASSTAK